VVVVALPLILGWSQVVVNRAEQLAGMAAAGAVLLLLVAPAFLDKGVGADSKSRLGDSLLDEKPPAYAFDDHPDYSYTDPDTDGILCPTGLVPHISEREWDDCAVPAIAPKHIRWQGRTLQTAKGMAVFSWEGVQAMMIVKDATSVATRLTSTFRHFNVSFFRVFVDDKPGIKVHIKSNSWRRYILVNNLDPNSTHHITVWYATDPVSTDWNFDVSNQAITISSFITDGVFGPAPPERKRRLVFIGDGITAGDHILTKPSGFDHCRGDHTQTSGALMCEYFQANCSTLALAGYGVYKNCCNDGPTMAELWKRINPGDPLYEFKFADFIPDAVVIHLGNYDANSITSKQQEVIFVKNYLSFLVMVTQRYFSSDLPIFCTIGPKSVPQTDMLVHDAVIRARTYGLTSVHFVSFIGMEQDGCDGHPGPVGNRQMFYLLKDPVAAVLRWNGSDKYIRDILEEENHHKFILGWKSLERLTSAGIPVWVFAVVIGLPLMLLLCVDSTVLLRKRREYWRFTQDDDSSLEDDEEGPTARPPFPRGQ
jgi:hypothetical protein